MESIWYRLDKHTGLLEHFTLESPLYPETMNPYCGYRINAKHLTRKCRREENPDGIPIKVNPRYRWFNDLTEARRQLAILTSDKIRKIQNEINRLQNLKLDWEETLKSLVLIRYENHHVYEGRVS